MNILIMKNKMRNKVYPINNILPVLEQAMRMLNQPDKSTEGVSILRLDSQEGDNSQSIEVCIINLFCQSKLVLK